MKLLVWGAGAIGGTMGAYFVRAGHDVTFVDVVDEHVRTLNEDGLEITGPIDTFRVPATAFTPETLSGTWDCVLLCVKAQHTVGAVGGLEPFLTPGGYVVSAQNGLNERIIADVVGAERTVGCFVNFGADYLEPGVIHYGGRGAVVLGELDGRDTDRIRALHDLFLVFDDRAIVTENIWGYLWGKLAYGAMLFATALTDASIADALDAAEDRPLYIALGNEVLRVAQARGIDPEGFNGFNPHAFMPGTPDAVARQSLDEMVAFNRKSAKTHSGIWRDLAVRKRPTEADAQLGPIVMLGAEAGVPTPLTERLISLVHDAEQGALELSWSALDPLRDLVATPR